METELALFGDGYITAGEFVSRVENQFGVDYKHAYALLQFHFPQLDWKSGYDQEFHTKQ